MSKGISLLGFVLVAILPSSPLMGQEIFRPDSERADLAQMSAYEKFIQSEGVPIYRGQAIPSLYDLELKPWNRMGGEGAYVVLDGMAGLLDHFVVALNSGARTKPQKHLFEEILLILDGEGQTQIWLGEGEKKHTVHWRKGTVFSPPLNSWHQHFNTGPSPAKFVTITNAPFLMDFFHDAELFFNIETTVNPRYSGQPDYFDPENTRNYRPYKGQHSLSLVNMIRNAHSARLSIAGQGYGDVDRHYVLSENRMGTHIESFPVGTYERAHHHGPAAAIIFLGGVGYSLYWHKDLGIHPFSDGKGDQVQKVDWQEGTAFVPDGGWYHQHFNTGKEPARFIKLGSPQGPGGRNIVYQMRAEIRMEGDRYMIRYGEEDPKIREMFVEDLKRNGGTLKMPSVAELAAMEEEAEKVSGGMLQAVEVD